MKQLRKISIEELTSNSSLSVSYKNLGKLLMGNVDVDKNLSPDSTFLYFDQEFREIQGMSIIRHEELCELEDTFITSLVTLKRYIILISESPETVAATICIGDKDVYNTANICFDDLKHVEEYLDYEVIKAKRVVPGDKFSPIKVSIKKMEENKDGEI